MEKLFQLSQEQVRELLTLIRGGTFNEARATYWPCSSALLDSKVFKSIEAHVERRLGRSVCFAFDELFTPSGSPDSHFQIWHKDSEDRAFDGGCFNVWIPLFASDGNVAGLEFIDDDELNSYDLVFDDPRGAPLPFPLAPGQLAFASHKQVAFKVVDDGDIRVSRPDQSLYGCYFFNSAQFHRAVAFDGFAMRFGIKFSLKPLGELFDLTTSPDVSLMRYAMTRLDSEIAGFAALEDRERCYAVARFVHEHLASAINSPTARSQVLYRTFLDSLLARTEP